MTNIELIDGKLYWIRWREEVYLTEYTDYEGMKWFNFFGTDEGEDWDDVEILGKAEIVIPDYAKGTKYG